MENILDNKNVMKENKPREKWIDALRGIAMLLVLLGHMIPGRNLFFVLTSPIKIPLFFVISGYVFSDRNRSSKVFFSKMIRTILIPYIILSMLPIKLLYALAIGSTNEFLRYLKEFISGEAYWYIPCFIIVNILTFYILKLFRGVAKYTAFGIAAGLGIVLSLQHMNNYGYYITALICLAFVMIGQIFKDLNITQIHTKYRAITGIVSMMVYLALFVISVYAYPGQAMDIHTNRFYNFFICGCMIASGCYGLFVSAHKARWPRWIIYIGKNTLYYYLLSPYFMMLLKIIYQKAGLNVENLLISLFSFVSTCIACTIAACVCNRYLPFLSRQTNNNRLFKERV